MNYRNLTDEETNVLKQWHAWGEPPLGPWAVIAYNNDVLGAFLGCGGYLSHFLPAEGVDILIAHIRRLEEKGEPEKREGAGSTCSERLGILERVREDLRRLRGKSKEEITRELGARVAYIKLDRFNQFLNKTTTSRRRSRHKGQCSRATD